jgi:preprotein translocase subunit SecE
LEKNTVVNYWLYIWIGLAAVAFIYLWRQGQLMKLANYVRETRDELKKCSWPTWAELKGSTVVVMISIALIGGFTMLVDAVFYVVLMRWIS